MITTSSMLKYCISRSQRTAVIHYWIFVHALMLALDVTALAFMLHRCISRSLHATAVRRWPFLHTMMLAL